MFIEVKGHRSKKFKDMVANAAYSYCERMISKKLLETIYLRIEIKKSLDEKDVEGFCYYAGIDEGIREFEIILKKGKSIREFLMYLAHECVHVKQFTTGELKDGSRKPRWQGQVIDEEHIDYWDLPWEIEAYGREKGLYHRFICEYKKHNKVKLDQIIR